MGEFIELVISQQLCVGVEACGACIKVCPVNIFAADADRPKVLAENQDECTLCQLCTEGCTPNAILLRKLYNT